MIPFLIALAFGVFETFLLSRLTAAVTAGNHRKAALYALYKFLSYGVAIALLMLVFLDDYVYCLCGFAVGMPLSAVLLFIYKTCFKKKYGERR